MKSLKYVLISLLAATGVTPVSADGATISAGEAKQLADRVERISQKEWDDLKGIEVIVGAAEKQKIATGIEIKKGEQYLVLPCSLDRWNSSPKRWQDVDFRGHTGAKEKAKSGMPYLQMCYSIDNDPLLSLVGHYILAEEGHLFLGSSDMAGGGNINNNRGRIRVKIIQISPGTVAPPRQ